MSKLSTLTDWIAVYDDVFSADFCDRCIAMFEDPNTVKGAHTAYWRTCIELGTFDQTAVWPEFKEIIKRYYHQYRDEHPGGVLNYSNTIEAPNMYRYDVDPEHPNIFNFHADNWSMQTATRQISIIAYLNDVDEGGETFFEALDLRVQPKRGRLLLFPSFFNYIHKGEAPISGPKYIVVSWCCYDGSGHAYRVHSL